jgi:hypothetical protein
MISVWSVIGLACSLAALFGIVYAINYFGKKSAKKEENANES